jgi:hypothetical protein
MKSILILSAPQFLQKFPRLPKQRITLQPHSPLVVEFYGSLQPFSFQRVSVQESHVGDDAARAR